MPIAIRFQIMHNICITLNFAYPLKAGVPMKHFLELLHKKVPRSGRNMPQYYKSALATSEVVLAMYFLLTTALFSWVNHRLEWMPALMCAGIIACHYSNGRINCRVSMYAFEAIILLWCAWHTHTVGWSYGAQHLLIPMLMLCFFNIYEPPLLKLVSFVFVVSYRTALFIYSLKHSGIYTMSKTLVILYQLLNSLTLFDILAIDFITFSSSIQESERELILNNQALHKEAGTDPLTQLPNRRAMLDAMDAFIAGNPDQPYSVAIADIDFFKKVNDTYGHHCGDYTLKELSRLFMASAGSKYMVCRWGGEEFCFFMPELNLDQAGIIMTDLNNAVRKMKLRFGDADYSITITIGVEEYDFQSSPDVILDKADRKLYMGKVHGRDQVVI